MAKGGGGDDDDRRQHQFELNRDWWSRGCLSPTLQEPFNWFSLNESILINWEAFAFPSYIPSELVWGKSACAAVRARDGGPLPATFVCKTPKSLQPRTNLTNETGRHGWDLVVFRPRCPPAYQKHLAVAVDPLPLPRPRCRPRQTILSTPLDPKDNTSVVAASIRRL